MSYSSEQAQAHSKARDAAQQLADYLKRAAGKAAELDELAGQAPEPLEGLEKGLEGHILSGIQYPTTNEEAGDADLERRRSLSATFLSDQKSALTRARNTLRDTRKNVAAVAKAAKQLEAWLEAGVKVSELSLRQKEKELAEIESELERRAAEREAKRKPTMAELQEKLDELARQQREYTNDRMQAAETHAKGLPYPYKYDDQGNLRPLAPTFDPKELPPMPKTKGME